MKENKLGVALHHGEFSKMSIKASEYEFSLIKLTLILPLTFDTFVTVLWRQTEAEEA